jgi:transcriptional regulator with XRE-family HTH domain
VTIAEALDAERLRLGLSVYEVAKRADRSAPHVHRVLDGTTANPGIETVLCLLRVLGRDLAWLQKQTTS